MWISLYLLCNCYVLPMRCIGTLAAIFQISCTVLILHETLSKLHVFKKCKCCAFKTHQRCTIITCDTSQFLRHIRCEIHSVFIDEVWYAQENTWDLTHNTNTCTRSAQLQSFEHHLRQSSLEIIPCIVYWRQSQAKFVELRPKSP